MLGIHHYSYHKRGYRIRSESSSLLSENSVAIQNLVCVHGMKFRARISLISPRSIPRRSVDAAVHTHRSRKQASIGCHAHAYIMRATRATCNRPFRAPSTPRRDIVIDPGIDRSIARPSYRAIKGQRVASVANLDRYSASTNPWALFESARLIIIWQPYSNIDSRLTIRCHSQAS